MIVIYSLGNDIYQVGHTARDTWQEYMATVFFLFFFYGDQIVVKCKCNMRVSDLMSTVGLPYSEVAYCPNMSD